MEPRAAFRGGLEKGITIGEFPLYSYILSVPCKVTGEWSYTLPKIFTYFCYLVGLLLWTRLLFPDSKEKRRFFALLSLSLSAIMTYIMIPIPDTFVFLLYACGATVLRKSQNESKQKNFLGGVVGLALLTLGFLIRPYFVFIVPYLYWITKDRRYIYSILPCIPAYYWWYKVVAGTTEIFYYYTGMPKFSAMVQDFLPALSKGWYLVWRDQLALFGVVFVSKAWNSNKVIASYALAVLIGLFFLRGDHLNGHQYYIIALTLIGLHLMTEGAFLVSEKTRSLLVAGMFVVLIATDQHLWHAPTVDYKKIRTDVAKSTTFKDRICTEGLGVTEGLYFALRTGWSDQWQHFAGKTFPEPHIINETVPYECPPGRLVIRKQDYLKEN